MATREDQEKVNQGRRAMLSLSSLDMDSTTVTASRNVTEGSRDFEAAVHYIKGEIYNFGVNDKLPAAGATLEDFQRRREELVGEHIMKITDIRGLPGGNDSIKFNTHGFAIFEPPPPPTGKFVDVKNSEEEYFPKLAEKMKEITGAKHAFVFNTAARELPKLEKGQTNAAAKLSLGKFAQYAHSDYGPESPATMRQMAELRWNVPHEEVESCWTCICNIWFPREHPAYKNPLAMLDASSVDWTGKSGKVRQRVTFDFNNLIHGIGYGMTQKQREAMNGAYYALWIGEMHGTNTTDSLLQGALYHPNQRWLYISDQKPTEAFIFKQWDERPDQQHNPQAFHNSFRDPFHEANLDLP